MTCEKCQAIRHLVGECNYGAVAQTQNDRRIMSILVEDCLSLGVVDPTSPLATPPRCSHYSPPPSGEVADVLEHVATLTGTRNPDVCGLHRDADVIKGWLLADNLLADLFKTSLNHHGYTPGGSTTAASAVICRNIQTRRSTRC